MKPTPQQIYDRLGQEILELATSLMRKHGEFPLPRIRAIMSMAAFDLFIKAERFKHMTTFGAVQMATSREFEFNGARVTVVPGEDIFIHVRCENINDSL